uniref:Uncharacterized protein n=1 Tax=Salarias fasciatus TaxID=181472 RepID=A0A672HNP5_SALFA
MPPADSLFKRLYVYLKSLEVILLIFLFRRGGEVNLDDALRERDGHEQERRETPGEGDQEQRPLPGQFTGANMVPHGKCQQIISRVSKH